MLWAFNIPHPSRILSPSFVGTLQLSPIRMASFGSRYWGYAHNDGQCALNWKKGVGYSSPHSKLKTCCGGKDKLIAAYWAAYNAKSTGTNNIHAAIQQAADFTPEETALNDWLTMIILKNWSLTSVECKLHCYMCKHRTTFSCKQICMMIHPWGGCWDKGFQDAQEGQGNWLVWWVYLQLNPLCCPLRFVHWGRGRCLIWKNHPLHHFARSFTYDCYSR